MHTHSCAAGAAADYKLTVGCRLSACPTWDAEMNTTHRRCPPTPGQALCHPPNHNHYPAPHPKRNRQRGVCAILVLVFCIFVFFSYSCCFSSLLCRLKYRSSDGRAKFLLILVWLLFRFYILLYIFCSVLCYCFIKADAHTFSRFLGRRFVWKIFGKFWYKNDEVPGRGGVSG